MNGYGRFQVRGRGGIRKPPFCLGFFFSLLRKVVRRNTGPFIFLCGFEMGQEDQGRSWAQFVGFIRLLIICAHKKMAQNRYPCRVE